MATYIDAIEVKLYSLRYDVIQYIPDLLGRLGKAERPCKSGTVNGDLVNHVTWRQTTWHDVKPRGMIIKHGFKTRDTM